MKLFDENKMVEIIMQTWEGTQWSPDFSSDFFAAGRLGYAEEKDAYCVADVDYCIDYARDWENKIGDFAADADDAPDEERCVDVTEIDRARMVLPPPPNIL